jgi:hypothetical protein
MTESGFLVVARLGGTNGNGGPPDHREAVTGALLRAAAEALGVALRIEELNPDEMLATAPDGALGSPGLLLDLLDQAYVAFRREQSRREASEVCPCHACAGASDVELSFTVHHGRWTRSRSDARSRCRGADVALTRLLSRMAARAGDSSLLTAAAVDRLGVEPEALAGTLPHGAGGGSDEDTEGPGGSSVVRGPPDAQPGEPQAFMPRQVGERAVGAADAGCVVLDLGAAWQRAEGATRRLDAADTMLSMESLLPVPPVDAWDWLIAPDKRSLWEAVATIASDPRPDRRPGVGTRYHSEQGKYLDEVYEVVEWEPFRGWTWDLHRHGVTVRSTVELSATDGGTRVVSHFGVAPGTRPVGRIRARREIVRRIAERRGAALERLRRILEVEQPTTEIHLDLAQGDGD